MQSKLAETLSINRRAPDRYPMIVHRLTSAEDLQNSNTSIVEEIWTLSSSSFGSRKKCCTPTKSTFYALCAIFTPLALTGGYLYYTFNNFLNSKEYTVDNPTFSPTISPTINWTTLAPTGSPTASPTFSPTASPTANPIYNTTWNVGLLGYENIPCVEGEVYHKMLFNISGHPLMNDVVKIKELKIVSQEDMIDPNHNIISDGVINGSVSNPIIKDEVTIKQLNNSFTMFKCVSSSSQTLELTVEQNGENKVSNAVYKVGN